jgi:hypothetical protein
MLLFGSSLELLSAVTFAMSWIAPISHGTKSFGLTSYIKCLVFVWTCDERLLMRITNLVQEMTLAIYAVARVGAAWLLVCLCSTSF